MENFTTIVYGFKPFSTVAKLSILDVSLGSSYTSDLIKSGAPFSHTQCYISKSFVETEFSDLLDIEINLRSRGFLTFLGLTLHKK